MKEVLTAAEHVMSEETSVVSKRGLTSRAFDVKKLPTFEIPVFDGDTLKGDEYIKNM